MRGNRVASVGVGRHNGACVQLVLGVHQRGGSSPLQQQAPAVVNVPPAACAAHLSWQELRGRRRACRAQVASGQSASWQGKQVRDVDKSERSKGNCPQMMTIRTHASCNPVQRSSHQ